MRPEARDDGPKSRTFSGRCRGAAPLQRLSCLKHRNLLLGADKSCGSRGRTGLRSRPIGPRRGQPPAHDAFRRVGRRSASSRVAATDISGPSRWIYFARPASRRLASPARLPAEHPASSRPRMDATVARRRHTSTDGLLELPSLGCAMHDLDRSDDTAPASLLESMRRRLRSPARRNACMDLSRRRSAFPVGSPRRDAQQGQRWCSCMLH